MNKFKFKMKIKNEMKLNNFENKNAKNDKNND